MKSRTGLVWAAAAAMALAAGCGGDDDDDPPPGMGGTGGTGTGGSVTGTGGVNATGGVASTGGDTAIGGLGGGGGATSCSHDETPLDSGGWDMGGTGPTGVYGWNFASAAEVSEFGVKAAEYGGDNAFDEMALDYGCGTMVATVTWPHEAGYEDAAPAEANKEITKTFIEIDGSWNLAGQTMSVTLNATELGYVGNGGIDVYLVAADGDWTSYDGDAGAVGEFTATGEQTFSLEIPAVETNGFDPTTVQQLSVRFDNKYWLAGEPFDYGTSVIEIDSLTWEATN